LERARATIGASAATNGGNSARSRKVRSACVLIHPDTVPPIGCGQERLKPGEHRCGTGAIGPESGYDEIGDRLRV
jgi:hypothetical protein